MALKLQSVVPEGRKRNERNTAGAAEGDEMKLNDLKLLIKAIEECDKVQSYFTDPHREEALYTEGLRAAMTGGIIERRANLIDKLKTYGINIEV